MSKLSKAQLQMLADIYADCEPTDYAVFADRAGSPSLGWHNREQVLMALIRKGLVNDDVKLTEAGFRFFEPVSGAL